MRSVCLSAYSHETRASAILAADPTLAADLALAAAVRRLEATGREWSIEARPMTYHVWTGVFGDPTTIAPTLIEAIEEALPDEPA